MTLELKTKTKKPPHCFGMRQEAPCCEVSVKRHAVYFLFLFFVSRSRMAVLVYGCQKPWLLPWQQIPAILCVSALQRWHWKKSEHGECHPRTLWNSNQLFVLQT